MRSILRVAGSGVLLLLGVLSAGQVMGEGTHQLSPASNKITALTLIPERNSGSFWGAPEANRLRFYISSTDEYVFCGFRWKEYVGSGSNPADVTMYYRLYNASNVLVGTGALPTSGQGYIQNYNQAFNGPNGVDGVTGTGYDPISFRISDFGDAYGTGEYSLEFYRSNNGGTTQASSSVWSTAPFFDLTVARNNGSTFTSIPGRVFCRKWGFVAVNSSLQVTAAANSSPSLYSYSEDQTIVRLGFNDVFRPIAYDMAVNFWGVKKTGTAGDFETDRRSVTSSNSPQIPDGYRLFLNSPDNNIYPVKPITVTPTLSNPPVTGCGTDLHINFNMPADGDARILLDLNGVTDYQEGTADRILEAFNVDAGQNTIAWDGKDGLGNTVANTAVMKISAIYERGRFNIPMYDAELNKNGFNVTSIAPLYSTTTPLYWNDLFVTNVYNSADQNQDNYTGAGINNSYRIPRCHCQPAHGYCNPQIVNRKHSRH